MQGIVTGNFITPHDATPAKARVTPSGDPDRPTVVDVPAWCYRRQTALGNLQGIDEFEMRRDLDRETKRRVAELEGEAERLREGALLEADKRAIAEEIDGLDDLDKDALVATARNHKISNVPTRGNDKTIRAAVKRGLEKKRDEIAERIRGLDAAPAPDAG